MAKSRQNSAKNSQYSSTGVGFHIRNDLRAITTAHYPLSPSQAPALGHTHTCTCARIAAILLVISIRTQSQADPNSRPKTSYLMRTSSSSALRRLNSNSFTARWRLHSDYASTSLQLNSDHTATHLQLNSNQTAAHLQLNSNHAATHLHFITPWTKTHQLLNSTIATPDKQPRHPYNAANKCVKLCLRITCRSLASHLHLHDPIATSRPRTITAKSNLICSSSAARPEHNHL